MIFANNLKRQIAIGAMDEKIILKVTTGTTTNSLGEVTAITSTDTTMAAYVENDNNLETDVNDKQTVIDQRIVITRYKACSVTDRFTYNSNIYDIIRIETMGRNRFMKLTGKLVN